MLSHKDQKQVKDVTFHHSFSKMNQKSYVMQQHQKRKSKVYRFGRKKQHCICLQAILLCMQKIQINQPQKNLELRSDYFKVVRYRVNRQKSIAFLYTINEQVEFEIKNIIIFILIPPYEILRFKSNKICTRYT